MAVKRSAERNEKLARMSAMKAPLHNTSMQLFVDANGQLLLVPESVVVVVEARGKKVRACCKRYRNRGPWKSACGGGRGHTSSMRDTSQRLRSWSTID